MNVREKIFRACGLLIIMASLTVTSSGGPLMSQASTNPRTARPTAAQPGAYHNPVIPGNAADPSVIRALDGYYYLFATSSRFSGSATLHIFPIWRSTDLVNWTYQGDAFAQAPDWVQSADALWAPDVHYFDGAYYLYYTADKVKGLPPYGASGQGWPDGVSAIGVATAPTPLGPWTDAGPSAGGGFQHGPIVPPSWGWCTDPTKAGCYNWTFDSFVYTGPDGRRWLYEGSYFGGNRLHQLSPDGLSLAPGVAAVQFGHNIRGEANYVVPHEVNGQRYYYMLNSESDCCAGANSPYSVIANRSTTPNGPFSDQNGAPMEWSYGPVHQYKPGDSPTDSPIWWNLADEGGGYPVLKQNGDGIVGAGGQAVIKDVTGQDWLVYHGIDEHNPWLNNGPAGDTSPLRQLFIDQLDWTPDGWPTVNDGNGPSVESSAPTTVPLVGDNFNMGAWGAPNYSGDTRAPWHVVDGDWQQGAADPATGGYLRQADTTGTALTIADNGADTSQSGYYAQCDLRAENDAARGSYGCATSVTAGSSGAQASYIAATVDAAHSQLILASYENGQVSGTVVTATLPMSFTASSWHHLAVKLDPSATGGPTVTATLENEDGNPLAEAHLPVSAGLATTPGGIALLTEGMAADFDNVTLAGRSATTAQPATAPATGPLDTTRSDDFGAHLGAQWTWLREDPTLHSFAPDGALSLTSNGNLDEWQRLNANATNPPDLPPTKNILLQAAPAGDYTIETKMHFDPQTPNLEAGLLVYSDDDTNVANAVAWNAMLTQVVSIRNMLSALPSTVQSCPLSHPMTGANVAVTQYSHELCPPLAEHTSQEYPASLKCCWAGNAQGPNGSYLGGNLDPSHITVWLRIYRHGDVYTPWFSLDDKTWTRENAWTLTSSSSEFPLKIGLFAQNNQQVDATGAQAWFDYFHVYAQDSGAGTPTAGATGTTTVTPASTATATVSNTATSAPTGTGTPAAAPTGTNTATAVSTETSTATSDPTGTGAATAVPTETGTATGVPTGTSTATSTPVAATSTSTAVPPMSTSTAVPPTSTPTVPPVCQLFVLPAFATVPRGGHQALLVDAAPNSAMTLTVKAGYPAQATLYTDSSLGSSDGFGVTLTGARASGGYRYTFHVEASGLALLTFAIPRAARMGTVVTQVTAQEPCGLFKTVTTFQVRGRVTGAGAATRSAGRTVTLAITLPHGAALPANAAQLARRGVLRVTTQGRGATARRVLRITYHPHPRPAPVKAGAAHPRPHTLFGVAIGTGTESASS